MSIERKRKEESVLEKLIVEILLPMSDVIVRKDQSGRICIFKEGIKFGMIKDDSFHLYDKDGEYQKVKREDFSNADNLLRAATKAFWHACNKIDFSKQS